jgi:hypothetical protein
MHQFPKFTPAWDSTCFGQFVCPSPGVYSLYTQQWYMSYSFVESFRAVPTWFCSKTFYKPVSHIPLVSVQQINSWWWAGELSETCRFSCRNKFVKLVHPVGFIIKKFVRMHGQNHIKFILNSFLSLFLYNKTNSMHQFHKFIPAWNSTYFGQFLCPSSGVYTQSTNLYDIYHCRVYSE